VNTDKVDMLFRNPTTVVIDFNDGAEPVEPIQQQQQEEAQVQSPVKEEAPQPMAEEKEVKKPEEPKPSPKVASPTARAVKTTIGARPRKAGKTAKLGIKKAPVNFNFEAAEAKAKEDQERKAKFGYDEEEEKEDESKEDATKKDGNTHIKLSTRLMYQDPQQQKKDEQEEEYEKLGFGMSRLSMNKKPSMPDQKPYQEQSTTARDKFGSARAISSDQYFGRNEYDPAVAAAESTRLSQFSNSKAISSDQYFGRESEYDHEDRMTRDNTANDWDNVQDNAVAMARKFVDQASADLDAVKDLAENASRSVRSYFA
jgi:ADP-ribosylation factor GTPase-activating protein 2/3